MVFQNLDNFIELCHLAEQDRESDDELNLWKEDHSGAFRLVPVLPAHYRYTNVLTHNDADELVVIGQRACPFGAVGSVSAYVRVAEALTAIAISLLVIIFCGVSHF